MSATSHTYDSDEAQTVDRTSLPHDDDAFQLVTAMTDRLLSLFVPALVIWVALIAFHG